MNSRYLVPGSVFGSMLLISGSCIGAGMLVLPILTGLAGFIPSLFVTLLGWAFMTYTALLLVEVNGWFYQRVNLISMAERSFGTPGKVVSWILYLFLFYALLVAYISLSGSIFSKLFFSTPQWIASLLFVLIFGGFVYYGTRMVDLANRWLMFGLIFCYFGMVLIGIWKVQGHNLTHISLKYTLVPLSVLVTSFGFHNLLPSITNYMKGDLQRVRIAVLGGSVITLFIYIFWQLFILGIIPYEGKMGIYDSFLNDYSVAISLKKFLSSPFIYSLSEGFALFAIITSFLAQSISLMHFIADGLKVDPDKKYKKGLLGLTLLPPLIFTFVYPKIFFSALSFAGGFCAVILFGILPALMAWVGRYKQKNSTSYHVAGGKLGLVLVISFASFLVIMEILRMTGFIQRV